MLGQFTRTDQAKRIVIDIETYDPLLLDKGVSYIYDLGYILGIGIKLDNEPAQYYPLRHRREVNYDNDAVRTYLRSIPATVDIVCHYAPYDIGWLNHSMGFNHAGKIRDTLIMAQLDHNTSSSYSLDYLSKTMGLGMKIPIDPKKLPDLPINTVAQYCCQDVELTAKLDDRLATHRNSDAANREFALIPILVKMKHKGIRINEIQLGALQGEFTRLLNYQLGLCGIDDIWANARIVELFNRLGISYPRTKPTKRHTSGFASFPTWFLESITDPKVIALHTARKLHRLINTFCVGIRNYIKNERIHPDFFNGRSEYGGTITGRFSSGHPNVQQIPHRSSEGNLLRSAFIPDDSKILVKFDYKQQEPILMLHYASKLNLSDIQKWRDLYTSPDADFYQPIQNSMNIERFPAKTITLATCYNMGPEKLSRMMHIDMKQSVQYLMQFRDTVKWLKPLKDHCLTIANGRGWIRTIGGRRLQFNRASANDSFNHLIQGSAADQTKQAMINIHEQLGLVPLLQVHDELLYELTEDQINQEVDLDIQVIMEDAFELDFPVRVDMKPGLNWMQCG